MKKEYFLINFNNLNILNVFLYLNCLNLVYRMGQFDGSTLHLDHLLQKSIRYQHHQFNYEESLRTGMIPKGLKIKKNPAFNPVTSGFDMQWKSVLYEAEIKLVELLLWESKNVLSENEIKVRNELEKHNINEIDLAHLINDKIYESYRKKLTIRRKKKWDRINQHNRYFMKENKAIEKNRKKLYPDNLRQNK